MHIKPIPIHIVTQLWGNTYITLYANLVLHTLMQEGNLPSLSIFEDIIYEIYTTESDKLYLESNSNFKNITNKLKNWITFRFVIIDEKIQNPYYRMSACHRLAIKTAEARNAAIIFLQPDVVMGKNSLKTVRDNLLSGKRLIMTPGLRTIREAMESDLFEFVNNPTSVVLPSNKKLVAMAVKNLHPISQGLFWRNGKVSSYCSHLYWQIRDSSIYARCAHMHPLMVYPRNKKCGFNHTIDWDYFYRACPNVRDWFIPENSDEILLLELSGYTKFEGTENFKPSNQETILDFLIFAARGAHIKLFQKNYLFKATELTEHDWSTEHQEANKIINEAIKKYNQLDRKVLAFYTQGKNLFLAIKDNLLDSKSLKFKIFYNVAYHTLRFFVQLNRNIISLIRWLCVNLILIKKYLIKLFFIIIFSPINFICFIIRILTVKFFWKKNLSNKHSNAILLRFNNRVYLILRLLWQIKNFAYQKANSSKIQFLKFKIDRSSNKFIYAILYYIIRPGWLLIRHINHILDNEYKLYLIMKPNPYELESKNLTSKKFKKSDGKLDTFFSVNKNIFKKFKPSIWKLNKIFFMFNNNFLYRPFKFILCIKNQILIFFKRK